MPDLGTIGTQSTPMKDGIVVFAVSLSGMVTPTPDIDIDLSTSFDNQSKPSLETYPGARLFTGF